MAGGLPLVVSGRLGAEASKGLSDYLAAEQQEWSGHVLTMATDRFDRRLSDEAAGLRVELAGLRVEMAGLGAVLRQEMAKDRFELLKWMFVFWLGQIAAMTTVFSLLLRR